MAKFIQNCLDFGLIFLQFILLILLIELVFIGVIVLTPVVADILKSLAIG